MRQVAHLQELSMTAIKIVKECHLVMTAVVRSPGPSEYTTLALLLSGEGEKKPCYSLPEFLHGYCISLTIFLFLFHELRLHNV